MPRNQSGSPSQGKRELSSLVSSNCGVPPSKTLKPASVSSSKITFVCPKRILFKLEFKICQRMALNTGSFGLALCYFPQPCRSAARRARTRDLKARRGRASIATLTGLCRPGSHLVRPLLWKPLPPAQEARTFGKGSPRPFLEKGTSRLRLLPPFLHPGRRGPQLSPARRPGTHLARSVSQPATHARGHARAGQTQTCLGLLIRDSGPAEGVGFQQTPTKFPLPGRAGAGASAGRPSRHRSLPSPPRHSPRGRSSPLFRCPHLRGAAVVAEVSAAAAAAGPRKPRVSVTARLGATAPAAEPPRCHAPVAAAPQHLLSASRTSSVPAAAFVSPSSKFLTSGRSARGRRTAVGTFFPGWGRAARGWRLACFPPRSAGGAR